MKKDLKKEILKYSSAAAAVLGATNANAQYQYTDIPDTTIDFNNGFYNLDIDQDGQMDFTITQYADTGVSGNINAVMIQPYTNTVNRVAGEKMGAYNYPFNLQAATVVDAGTNWNGVGGQFTNGYMAFVADGQAYPNSNWVGPLTNGFLGLELRKNGLPYYGWARLDIGEDSKSFTVKDFSINLSLDSAIVVGAELLGEMENLLEGITIAVNESSISIRRHQIIGKLEARLYDINGRLLDEVSTIDMELELNTNTLSEAIYILELQQGELVRREKLLIR